MKFDILLVVKQCFRLVGYVRMVEEKEVLISAQGLRVKWYQNMKCLDNDLNLYVKTKLFLVGVIQDSTI